MSNTPQQPPKKIKYETPELQPLDQDLAQGHCQMGGVGLLIAASGSQGKTTCCRRLPGGWLPLCDDESLVVRVPGEGYAVHPFPTWSEHVWQRSAGSWDVQQSVPLRALFFLEQSGQDAVVPLGGAAAAARAYGSAFEVFRKFWWHAGPEALRRSRSALFASACNIAARVPAFRLRAALNGRFWELIERTLEERCPVGA